MKSPRIKIYAILSVFALCICAVHVSASPQFEGLRETGVRTLEVEASLLDVEVNGVPGSTLTVRGEDISKNIAVKYKRRGDVLRVWVEKRFYPLTLRKSGSLYIEVPMDTGVELKSSTGEIVIRNMESDLFSTESSSGNISISNVFTDVRAKSSSGDINIGMIEGSVYGESSSGRIEVINVNGGVYLSASSGDLRLSAIEGNIEAASSSGRIILNTIKGALRIKTSSGDITGEDVLISGDSVFESSSGRIDMNLDNQLNGLTFRLKSSSGKLEVGNLSGEKNLAAGEGTIRITGETSSGDQTYR